MLIMLGWCIGKCYRSRPVTSPSSALMRWCFAEIDDAEFFQATFGGTRLDAARVSPVELIRSKPRWNAWTT
jgi:hypothetical protein